MWKAALEWRTDDIHREFFDPRPYTHLHIRTTVGDGVQVHWTYTFFDMGMQFVIDKHFSVSKDGLVVGEGVCKVAADEAEMRRLVFDHYAAYVANLRHLDSVMEDRESMDI